MQGIPVGEHPVEGIHGGDTQEKRGELNLPIVQISGQIPDMSALPWLGSSVGESSPVHPKVARSTLAVLLSGYRSVDGAAA